MSSACTKESLGGGWQGGKKTFWAKGGQKKDFFARKKKKKGEGGSVHFCLKKKEISFKHEGREKSSRKGNTKFPRQETFWGKDTCKISEKKACRKTWVEEKNSPWDHHALKAPKPPTKKPRSCREPEIFEGATGESPTIERRPKRGKKRVIYCQRGPPKNGGTHRSGKKTLP